MATRANRVLRVRGLEVMAGLFLARPQIHRPTMAVHRIPHAADFSLHRLQPGERMIERPLDGLQIAAQFVDHRILLGEACLLYTSPSPRD